MRAEIRAACRETDQPVPVSDANWRAAFSSGAVVCRHSAARTGKSARRNLQLHIVGGGCKTRYLTSCARACGIRVMAGPVEASTLGNIGIHSL